MFSVNIEGARKLELKLVVSGPEPRWWWTHRIGTARFQEQEGDSPSTNPGTPIVQGSVFEAQTSEFQKPNIESLRFQDCDIRDCITGI